MRSVQEALPSPTKIRFRLERDEDGWPPAESEGVWAVALGGDAYRIDNIPWFVRDVAADDVFQAEPDADGVMWARQRLSASGNCTIRVIPHREGPLRGSEQAVLDIFVPLGVSGEGHGGISIVALSVPPDAAIGEIKQRLQLGERGGWWAYEEGRITPEWQAA